MPSSKNVYFLLTTNPGHNEQNYFVPKQFFITQFDCIYICSHKSGITFAAKSKTSF